MIAGDRISSETLAPGFQPIPFGFAGGIYDPLNTKPRGPQCKPKLNQPDPAGCEQ